MDTASDRPTDLGERFTKALGEFLITFSPFLVLIAVLWFSGNLHTLLDRSDLAFLMAVLFADGAWRVHGAPRLSVGQRHALLAVGIVGALLCTASATATLYGELHDFSAARRLAMSVNIGTFNVFAYASGVIYALTARTVAP